MHLVNHMVLVNFVKFGPLGAVRFFFFFFGGGGHPVYIPELFNGTQVRSLPGVKYCLTDSASNMDHSMIYSEQEQINLPTVWGYYNGCKVLFHAY